MTAGLPAELSALLEPAAYPHPTRRVQLIETHISWVFLTGELAYKVKKPVHLAFADLRSVERRAFCCAEELRLNRRFAAELYLRVCRVTFDGQRAWIDGPGEVIDHAVCMRQFDAADELGALLAGGRLEPQTLAAFARELARLHAMLPRPAADDPWGHADSVRALLLRNLAECRAAAEMLGAAPAVDGLSGAYAARIEAAEPWLASRRAAGQVRECHGDLHVGNIARYGGRLLAFDCIEFEPAFRWIDVADEIAFLWMDLHARGFPAHAQACLGGYCFEGGDYGACRLVRLYGVHRALVRAKVAALRAADASDPQTRAASRREHGRYLGCAHELLAARPPRLVLMCGLSGAGKTWLAERLAPALGAVHLRSDVERKRLGNLRAGQRSGSALAQGLYSAPMSAATYERLRQCAEAALGGGFSVIIDASCQRREQRARLSYLGAAYGVPVHVFLCHAPRAVLEARLAARERAGADASEANLSVLALQQTQFEPIGAAEGLTVIEADTTRVDLVPQLLAQLQRQEIKTGSEDVSGR
ncbi:MAG TPA: AAA family ATPase [Steroidobacteraceae bacterium]|nr:AAA family ATPase [Steroidobacteraceae bacterium]